MLWIKSLHIIAMVTWFAALFYLPRLFVYHAQAEDRISQERFCVMERKLFFGIMTPGGVITILSGSWLWLAYGFSGGWLVAKLRREGPEPSRGSGGIGKKNGTEIPGSIPLLQRP